MSLPFIFFSYFIAFSLAGFSAWLGSSFDNPSIDQIVYHFYYSEGAAIKLGEIFFVTLFVECVGFPIVYAGVATFAHEAAFDRPRLSRKKQGLSAQYDSKRQASAGQVLYSALPVAAITVGVTALLLKLSAFSFVGYRFADDHFSGHFANPKNVNLKAMKLKNLVLIYVESLENTYGDTRAFEKDLLRPIRQLGGVSFDSYLPAAGTTWTIAGMVATQCGVPLRVYSEYNIKKRHATQTRSFLPGATCLGDILQTNGYHNVFLGGAPLSFAGKGEFLKDHGYQTVYGRDEWEKEGLMPSEVNEWGLYDSALFERAKAKVKILHESGQRFNLTLLTLDTHNPRGFLSKFCISRGAKKFEDIVECTSQQLADFIKFLSDSGYLKDTNVVILGDHLAVPNPVFDRLKLVPERHIFNQFISDAAPAKNTDVILPFDLFPTIIEFTGIQVQGDRLGLGYSGFFEPEVRRPEHRLEELTLPSLGGSASYNSLWQPKPSQ